jgi:deoxyribose-phosphate aldolase
MNIASYIDHTILKPEATTSEVDKLCQEAIQYGFASVCVNACHIERVISNLKGTQVKSCVVTGFPLGASRTSTKIFETEEALKLGVDEVDTVINVGFVKEQRWDKLREELSLLANLCHQFDAQLKIIFEICLLTDEEIIKLCELCVIAGVDFVKTSTGFSKSGATIEAVGLMKSSVQGRSKVKASGGIRSFSDAIKMINAGADRIGTSSGPNLLKG